MKKQIFKKINPLKKGNFQCEFCHILVKENRINKHIQKAHQDVKRKLENEIRWVLYKDTMGKQKYKIYGLQIKSGYDVYDKMKRLPGAGFSR